MWASQHPASFPPPVVQYRPAAGRPDTRSGWRRGSSAVDLAASVCRAKRIEDQVQESGAGNIRDKGAVLIAGPTASGKSALALAVAERIGGVVVNADSMQVYRDLAIITARPGAVEVTRVPHLLYGHVDAAESYS